ncbi:hypothetical protein Ctob_013489 [Chrysochromulina tobinii]|uniref:Uncharacterized protein n=1 Tax=Chrysochromulina tobinii TaxID=1460289 RepID=A0A0M0K870_9EUKA|nr:hypothetical protein Ctob_013489 [Chrysochromulina tobinii]|eukprot:KOO34984.1 hypothetical protein Ctob_013489 [Chrysochromulina sp. CCMP291]
MGAHEAAQVGDTSDKSDEMRTAPPPLAKPSLVSLSEHQSARAAEAALEAATAAQQEQRVAAALAACEAAAAAEQRVLLDELHTSEEAIARNFATREAQVNQRLSRLQLLRLMRQWAEGARTQRARIQAAARLVVKEALRPVGRALVTWRDRCEQRRLERRVLARMRGAVPRAWATWRELAEQRRLERAVLARMRAPKVAAAFGEWRKLASDEAQRKREDVLQRQYEERLASELAQARSAYAAAADEMDGRAAAITRELERQLTEKEAEAEAARRELELAGRLHDPPPRARARLPQLDRVARRTAAALGGREPSAQPRKVARDA